MRTMSECTNVQVFRSFNLLLPRLYEVIGSLGCVGEFVTRVVPGNESHRTMPPNRVALRLSMSAGPVLDAV